MKYKLMRDLDIPDIKQLGLKKGDYVDTEDIDIDLLEKSLQSGDLKRCIEKGWIVEEAGDYEYDEEEIAELGVNKTLKKVIDWIISNDVKFGFSASSYSGSAGGTVEVEIRVTDGDGTIDTFNNIVQVAVAVDGNATIQESMPVRFTNGIAKITIQDDTAETVNLSLVDSESTGLDVSDPATVVFS